MPGKNTERFILDRDYLWGRINALLNISIKTNIFRSNYRFEMGVDRTPIVDNFIEDMIENGEVWTETNLKELFERRLGVNIKDVLNILSQISRCYYSKDELMNDLVYNYTLKHDNIEK